MICGSQAGYFNHWAKATLKKIDKYEKLNKTFNSPSCDVVSWCISVGIVCTMYRNLFHVNFSSLCLANNPD